MLAGARHLRLPAAALLAGVALAREAAAEEPVLVEFHYTPVANTQIAIWLEDRDGEHARDVLVTQATGKYGIGNRPGRWDFVSSWRAPYGPRPSVLPIWAHRRGRTYPRVIFHDQDPGDDQSLGWHENTSTAENYFCIPLTAEEHETVVVDTMTCPSPKNFKTDKGTFDPLGGTSVYPPRNDLIAFDAKYDSPDVRMYAALNDLDAVTAATPVGGRPEFTTLLVPPDVLARAPLTAFIEVSREHDENAHYEFDREADHHVDHRLASYGVEYLGQPSVVYRVDFDPRVRGFTGTSDYHGHGDWDGMTGQIHPPDGTISESGGSGADRLERMTKNGDTFRWGVFSHGEGGQGGVDTDGWGSQCAARRLAPVDDLALSGTTFDRVHVSFRMPGQGDPEFQLKAVHVYYITGEMALTEELLGAAHLTSFNAAELAATEGLVSLEIGELWGDYTYQFAVVYEDRCTNRSELAGAAITTDAQQFQTVDGLCFLATAAWGAPWAAQVAALRSFRDVYLKTSATGLDLVRFYHAHSPPLARVIRREPLLRGLARALLQPIADAAALASAPARATAP